jgi:hypothetical protein
VRRWVLEAFRFTLARLNHDVAVERLKRVAGGLTHPDTKRAAASLMEELQKPQGPEGN